MSETGTKTKARYSPAWYSTEVLITDYHLAKRAMDGVISDHQFVWTTAHGWLEGHQDPHPVPEEEVMGHLIHWLYWEYQEFLKETPVGTPPGRVGRAWERHFSYRHLKGIYELTKAMALDRNWLAEDYEESQRNGAPVPHTA